MFVELVTVIGLRVVGVVLELECDTMRKPRRRKQFLAKMKILYVNN